MKRIGVLAVLAILALALVACNPSQQAMWNKNKQTGYGGVVRHIVVRDAITGLVVYDKTGRCFIDDSSNKNDIAILWTSADYKTTKKDDIIGEHMILTAEEQ